jgi:polysaccharide biosynthesis protein PslH
MKWLFVTSTFPWPLAHGTNLRVYHLARALTARGDSVMLVSGPPSQGSLLHEGTESYRQMGVDLPAVNDNACIDAWHNPYGRDPALAAAVQVQSPAADATVLFRPSALQYAGLVHPGRTCVADFVDDPLLEEWHMLRHSRMSTLPRGLARLARHWFFERRHLKAVAAVTFVSPWDARAFARRHPCAHVRVIANGVDVAYFAPPSQRPGADGEPGVTFLGHLSHPPNADAARYLLDQVAPRLRQSGQRVRFVILGSSPSPELLAQRRDDVEITGWVEDLRPWLWRSTVVLLPMRVGTGIKNKLLEAWAAGCAVVATRRACQGIPARQGQNLLQADSPAELAAAVQTLIRDADLRRRLGEAGRQTVLTHFTWPAAAEALRSICSS